MIAGIEWWVYLIIVLIFLSGYMAYRAMSAERKIEQQYIEHEGKVYMKRMEVERENKQRANQHISE